jgi:DNA-binding CsgD family transcriptional regulator/tetratricopeptide (TPR) repeat protein
VTAVPLVGRDADLARLLDRLDAGLRGGGDGAVVLVVGPPGIGKTRLVRAALEAKSTDATVLFGGAPALTGGLAFAPIVEALGPHLRGLDRRRQAAMLDELPDLARLFPDLAPPPPPTDAGLERMRLFDAIARLLSTLAAQQPVILAVDDLHRADPITLQLLDYVSRGLADAPLVVVATARDVIDDQDVAFRALRNTLVTSGRSSELELGRLEPDAVAAMAHDLLGGDPPTDLLSLLADRAAGIPLFVATLVTGLIESGALTPTALGWSLHTEAATAVPRLVRDLVAERLDGLTEEVRRLLELVSVHGEALDHDILVAASGLDDAGVVAAVRRLRLAGLLVEGRTGGTDYTGAHPLIVEVADAELTEVERRRRHAALASAFEKLRPADVSRLARHYGAAGPDVADRARVFEVLCIAADAAPAPDEAARHLRGALSLADAGERAGALDRLAQAEARAGNMDAAVAAWHEALNEAVVSNDPTRTALTQRRVALAEWDLGRLDDARTRIDAALTATGIDPEALAALHDTRADFADRVGDLQSLEETVAALDQLAATDGAPRVTVAAALAEVALDHRRGDLRRSREAADRALVAADATDDPSLQLRAHEVALNLTAEYGDPVRLRQLAERSLELADVAGGPPTLLRAHGCLIVAAYLAGDWDVADRETEIAMGVARRAGIVRGIARAMAMKALMLAQQGNTDEAANAVVEARAALLDIGGDAHVATTLALAEANLAIEAGDVTRGLQLQPQLEDPAGSLLTRRLQALGELQATSGDTAAARETAARMQAADDTNPYGRALVDCVLARAAQTDGDSRAAIGHLAAAVSAFDAVGARFEANRSRIALAALSEDPEPAKQALAAFESMGGARWADRARSTLRQLGVRVERPRPSTSTELSDRELEVARLAARGLTTAEIAHRLVISPRTASTHLQRIYRRLDVSSRAALTKRMLETGLL